MKHLMRTWYKTDADRNSVGTFSASIPDSALEQGRIVAIEWGEGEVCVTFLLDGPGHDRS